MGCTTEELTPDARDSGPDVTGDAVFELSFDVRSDTSDARADADGGPLKCGDNVCPTFVDTQFTFRGCCPSSNPTKCGYALPTTGVCIERDQPGVVDPSCPRFVIPQRNRDGGTADVDPDSNPDYFSRPGCCKPNGLCGFWDNVGDASYTGGGYGCVYHKDWSEFRDAQACDYDAASSPRDAASDVGDAADGG
jgi:hypothetical protein